MGYPSERVVEYAKQLAVTSPGVGRRNHARVGAVLFRKNKIIKAKTNSYKTHPLLTKYTKWPFLHAETSCLFSHGLDNCSDLDLLVVRVHRDSDTLSCAKPCPVCSQFIRLANVRETYYTNWTGDIMKCE